MSEPNARIDQHKFVKRVILETGCDHEQAMMVLGHVLELTQQVYGNGYNDGYTHAINANKLKGINNTEDIISKSIQYLSEKEQYLSEKEQYQPLQRKTHPNRPLPMRGQR